MDDQLTLRLPADLARAIRRLARERKVTQAAVVREALQAYLAGAGPEDPDAVWRRLAPLVGSVRLDPARVERDALARRVKTQNWRD